jgi:hypothetical protein
VEGPHIPGEPKADGPRHPVLDGFELTDILPFGGTLDSLGVSGTAKVLMTFVPAFPAFPPETAWMRQPRTDIPGLVVDDRPGRRVAFLPADIDRRFAIDGMPDHGDLLANLVRWAAGDSIPLRVTGPGLLNVELYRQPGRFILHLVNLTSAGSWRAPAEEVIPVGPLRVSLRLPAGARVRSLTTTVTPRRQTVAAPKGVVEFELRSLEDHELVILE